MCSDILLIRLPSRLKLSNETFALLAAELPRLPNGWQDFKFNVDFAGFNQSRAATSWLRSAYLAWFAALGYRFSFRPELDIVRDRIKNPESKEPATFPIIQPKPVTQPTLLCLDEPEPFRSYAMLYGRNVIFLPRRSFPVLPR
jgi:hypothetical protein